MSKNLKKLISALVCIMLLVTATIPAFADNSSNNPVSFKDVPKGHWAYNDIMWMLERKIIDGVGDGRFNPDGTVTRAQFAKMMVNTLNLQTYSPEKPSFLDVNKKAWEYPFVEGAKNFLTGFRTPNGDYFKPSQAAVREDMAVALVKALGYQNEAVDESILNRFADAGQISFNLRKYVALSVKYGLVTGYTQNGQTVFGPQGSLTRAQSATLLHKAFKNSDDKVTYDEDKVTYDANTYVKPSVTVKTENNTTVVRWNKIASKNFKEYRIVISKNNPSPKYPADGYLYSITDSNRTFAVIDNSAVYNGGDFGKYLTKGERYYFSVTAVYNDRVVAGNTVRFQYGGADNPESYVTPVVSATEENGRLVLRWTRIDSPNLVSYRVVASKNDSSPAYPDNGYLYTITDRSRNYAVIDNSTAYTRGDFGGYFIKGEKYYFTVTAVYKDRTRTGNTLQTVYNGDDNPARFPAPAVTAAYDDEGKLIVKWNKIDSSQLEEYRLVISQKNQSPAYPANGFFNAAYDKNTTSAAIDASKPYTNGDFKELTYGNEYYFSVTAVYKNNKTVAGNAVKVLYLIPDKQ